MKILKPLKLLFLDPFSKDGDEEIELDISVFENKTQVLSDI